MLFHGLFVCLFLLPPSLDMICHSPPFSLPSAYYASFLLPSVLLSFLPSLSREKEDIMMSCGVSR